MLLPSRTNLTAPGNARRSKAKVIETIQLWPILRAMNKLIDLWDHKTHEQWLTDAPYPQRVPTNQISYWPAPTDDADDSNWLCNLNGWVGSYPVILNNTDVSTEKTDPGPFRALVSSSYKKEGTGGNVSYTFAFCGLASRIGDEYEMCWPLDDTDEEQNDFN
ncbi:hypothetical protein FRC06_002011 [Ceratobasidium sp. 370]|nr:hypothetical protein FRC06_002011 [Ceratobasidium sp. 370]